MKEKTMELPTAAGRMETFITHPEADKQYPAIILYMDVWGVREVLFDLARHIGTVGYYVVVPDLYYRQGRIRTDFRDEHGRAISLTRLDPVTRDKVLAPQKALTDAMVIEDTRDILRFLDEERVVKPDKVGTIGYCMGGRNVLQIAGHYPERIRASAGLHGTAIISDQKDSAHLTIGKSQGEVYCGFAEVDPYTPLSMVEQWNALMRTCGSVKYSFRIHTGAHHGYALPDRDIHDKQASNRDWEHIFDMFRRQLSPYEN